ncbi:NADH:flavin oxidoreductase/NADH oxidase [Coprinopsis cinerea AmutBmut pab1-1]|nr:NADH:flavin oxidoreductase/NADH oxidase [Coprinopsis cinerea AmutBmut pab1-1]
MASALSPKPALFQPKTVGAVQLKHRVVQAPCTRVRNNKAHVPVIPLMKTYYEQRSRVPGTLLITEATLIADEAGGLPHVPGIWNDEQVEAWKQITDAVHANQSFIFLQLWALGRAAGPANIQGKGFPYVSASPIPLSTNPPEAPRPRELTIQEIQKYVGLFGKAAKRAVADAGFDGVEIHGANGYLVDQFLQDVSNKRTDEYGGSIEARSKFGLEVVDAVAKQVGAERTSIRLSPWSTYQDMRMKDPMPQFVHFVTELAKSHPNLAYIHLTEAAANGTPPSESESNDPLREAWAPRPFISCGGYTRETAIDVAEKKGDLIAFGADFIANPDLPYRLEKNLALNPVDRSTYYVPGSEKGYIDYPFSEEFLKEENLSKL